MIVVYKGLTNTLEVDLGIDITGDTIRSEIRTEPKLDATLILTWVVTVDDEPNGLITLTADNTITEQVVVAGGWMDVRRETGGEPVPVFEAQEVEFRGVVTGDGS